MTDCALGLVRQIDLAILQALDQVIRRQIDQFDVVCLVDNRIRHCLAHPDSSDPGHNVVQAFDMLDVERGVDIDADCDQLFDIHVTLGVSAAWRVGMRQLIDQRQLWASCQEGVEVHLLQRASLVLDALSGKHLHAVEQCFGFLPTVSSHDLPRQRRRLPASEPLLPSAFRMSCPRPVPRRRRSSSVRVTPAAPPAAGRLRRGDFRVSLYCPSVSPSALRSIEPIADLAMT